MTTDNVVVRFDGNSLLIQAPYSDLDALHAIPGLSFSKAVGAWRADLSPAIAQSLMTSFQGRLLCNDVPRLRTLAKQSGGVRAICSSTVLADVPGAKLQPWPHQKQQYWAMVDQPALLAYYGMGVGKTAPIIWFIQNQHLRRTLVVAPLNVVSVWCSEAEKHATSPVAIWHKGDRLPTPGGILVVPLDRGSVTQKNNAVQEAFNYDGSVVIVTNYEASWRSPLAEFFMCAGFDLLVMDEAHKLQSPGSRVSKYFQRLGRVVPKRVALTGTPCPNGILSAYGLFRALDSGVFGTSFAAFREKYAIMGGYERHEVVGYKNKEEYNRRFYSIAIHADRSVLTLPEATTLRRTATLSPSAAKVYRSLEKDLVAQLGEGTVTAANGLVKLLRLSQLTGGWLTPDADVFNEDAAPQRVDVEKEKLLQDVLDDLPREEPVVVFYKFTQDAVSIGEVCKEQGRAYSELSGRRNDLAEWQENGQVLAVQIATGGLGVDLTRAAYCVYYSVGYSLSEYEQSLARVHRPGQDRAVTYIQLIMTGTVDERVYAALQVKADVVAEVLRDMKEGT